LKSKSGLGRKSRSGRKVGTKSADDLKLDSIMGFVGRIPRRSKRGSDGRMGWGVESSWQWRQINVKGSRGMWGSKGMHQTPTSPPSTIQSENQRRLQSINEGQTRRENKNVAIVTNYKCIMRRSNIPNGIITTLTNTWEGELKGTLGKGEGGTRGVPNRRWGPPRET